MTLRGTRDSQAETSLFKKTLACDGSGITGRQSVIWSLSMSNCIFLHCNFKINPKKGYQSQKNSCWDGQKESLDGGGRLTEVWFTLQFSRFICICVILVIHVHSTTCGYAWGRESQRRLLKIECEIDLKPRGRKGKWEGGSHSPLFPGLWQHFNYNWLKITWNPD